jgi:hypothetical protein
VRLSVCIPTHDGRCDDLAAALERLVAQAAAEAPGTVELCVTDNASADGTEAMIAGLVAAGAPIRYRRHPRDLGATTNVMASVALATGEWCWLHASDDLIADGALRAVLAATAVPGDVAGVTIGRATFDAAMVREREVDPAALLPSDSERARIFDDPFEAIAELGMLFTYLPSQVVRRAAWEAIVVADARRPLTASAYYSHVYVLVRILLNPSPPAPRWSWVPDKLVMNRPRHDVALLGGSTLAAALSQPADLVHTWSAALGPAAPGARPRRRRPLRGRTAALHRALLRRAAGIWAVPAELDALKARPGHTLGDDGRMLWALVRVFWSLPAFWRTALPRLLTPHRLVATRRRSAMPALAPAELTITVAAVLPVSAVTARNLVLDCEIVNHSAQTVRSTEPHPVHVGARWHDEGGQTIRELDRALLPAALAPGARCRVTLTTPTPWAPGRFVLDVSAVQERVAWCIDVNPDRGVRATIDVRTRVPLKSPERG